MSHSPTENGLCCCVLWAVDTGSGHGRSAGIVLLAVEELLKNREEAFLLPILIRFRVCSCVDDTLSMGDFYCASVHAVSDPHCMYLTFAGIRPVFSQEAPGVIDFEGQRPSMT